MRLQYISFERSLQRFWSGVDTLGEPTTCWEWRGCKNRDGYGKAHYRNREIPAHRLSWQFVHGPIPPGMIVMHFACDNPSCVNPSHFRLGTHLDNQRDCIRKGRRRHPHGVDHWQKRLPYEVAAEIRYRYESDGISQKQIAREFHMSEGNVSAIVKYKTHRSPDYKRGPKKNRKLADEQAAEIRRRYAAGGTSKSRLGREFGISYTLVRYIVEGLYYT